MRVLLLVPLLLLILFAPVRAEAEESTKSGTLSFVLENDLFYNIDRHYTSGVRLVWVPDRAAATPRWAMKAAGWVPWFPAEGTVRPGYALGQSMFTPSDITIADPPPGERPYAGWLYGTIGLGVESGRQLDQFGITFGMVGPASLAEESQKSVHKTIDSDEPKGWDTQLKNEPGLVLTYQRSWRELAAKTFLKNEIDFSPHVGGALGNVFTYANAGLTMRYGRRLPNDYGPPRIQPGLPGTSDFSPTSDFGWYLFAGVDGRVVARNIFLDGNTFRDSRSVDKYPLVGDLQFGLVLDWPSARLSYTHVLRTKEFRTQKGNDDFGAISLSVKF
ncbi:MAG: lipid A deacylase LpxR family protein [Desulfuromonas sp.]|nr:lipid A deacylase LpxR family protein [Desulfuromonas sp.]